MVTDPESPNLPPPTCLDGPLPLPSSFSKDTSDLSKEEEGGVKKQYPIPLHYEGPGENPYTTPID